MAWIELHQAVWTHRKTFELADLLDIDETYAAAHVIRLWTWALDNAPTGDVGRLSPRTIAAGAGWRGDARQFAEALVQAGWLDDDGSIHDWHEYAGRLIERRRQDAERKRMPPKAPADIQRSSAGHPSEFRRNRTVPNRTVPDQQPTVVEDTRGASADAATTTAADDSPRVMVAGYLSLSEPARRVVDDWRAQQGRKRPPKLNPAQCAEIELAVVELGVPALLDANAWAARNDVPEIVKALRAARTKRQRDEETEPAHSGKTTAQRDASGVMSGESLAAPTDADAALWEGARSDLAEEMSRPNWETYIAPLAVAGRAADGGLRLRAPPGLVSMLARFRGVIIRALADAGDDEPQRVAIVEARRTGQE